MTSVDNQELVMDLTVKKDIEEVGTSVENPIYIDEKLEDNDCKEHKDDIEGAGASAENPIYIDEKLEDINCNEYIRHAIETVGLVTRGEEEKEEEEEKEIENHASINLLPGVKTLIPDEDYFRRKYNAYKSRVTSFKHWPHIVPTVVNMSKSGFFYTGIGDIVTCFYCGMSFQNWQPTSSPFVEHLKYSNRCDYIYSFVHNMMEIVLRREILIKNKEEQEEEEEENLSR